MAGGKEAFGGDDVHVGDHLMVMGSLKLYTDIFPQFRPAQSSFPPACAVLDSCSAGQNCWVKPSCICE